MACGRTRWFEGITDGTISIGGRVVNELPPKDRDLAMVFQNYALYQHMTVYGNFPVASNSGSRSGAASCATRKCSWSSWAIRRAIPRPCSRQR